MGLTLRVNDKVRAKSREAKTIRPRNVFLIVLPFLEVGVSSPRMFL